MSKRNKLRLRNFKIYAKKNIFNSRYIVRNILAVMMFLTFAAAVYGTVSFVSFNNNNKVEAAKDNIHNEDEQIVIAVNDTSMLEPSSISLLMASMDAGSDIDIEAKESEMITEAYKEFEDKCVSIADNVNVRKEADTESDIVGKMNDGAVADIISSDGEWLNISSGEVTGYVKAEFVKTGNDACEYAKDFYSITGKVTEDGVNIRQDATTESAVIAAAYTGVDYKVDKIKTEAKTGWVCVWIDNSEEGYINEDYIEVTEGYPVAALYGASSEGINKADDIDNSEVDNKDTKKDDTDNKNTKTEDTSKVEETEELKTEETTETVKKEETTEELKEEALVSTEEITTEETTEELTTEEEETESKETQVAVTARGNFALTEEDINLMAAVMTLECGNESYEGQLAVANVILNRLQTGRWGSTISGVVYAPSQFTVVNLASFNTYISPSCLQAAREACAGTNNIGGYMYFRPVSNIDTSTLDNYTIIGNHCFF